MNAEERHADDAQSQRSSLTSVFHELLGDGLAKQAAELPFLVQRTDREGKLLISRQRRETRRGEVRKFSTCTFRRLEEEEALDALEALRAQELSLPDGIEQRLAAAMYARVPIWHVLVKGVDEPRRGLPVSIYFLQNLHELREFAHQCLIEVLEVDDPTALQTAASNHQFQEWCRQWYQQSEDLRDTKSVRYICRLSGCAVLTHCVRNNFGDCTDFLLRSHSDLTSPEPWLVLAEPMRYFGKFQGNAFHEAAYTGSAAALESLVRFGNAHNMPWREAVDKEGKTALEVAQGQAGKGRPGAEACFQFLRSEYSTDAELPVSPAQPLAEDVLIVTWYGEEEQELSRVREPLPAEASWSDLVLASRTALRSRPSSAATPMVLVYKGTVVNADLIGMTDFLEQCTEAKSIGFFKTRMRHPDAPLNLCTAMRSFLGRPVAPAWQRAYVFQPLFGIDRTEDSAARLSEVLRGLAETLASRPELPLWRLDHFPASLLLERDRYVANLLGAAMDVKHCAHQLRKGTQVYRFFWARLEAVERHMTDRMRLLNDSNVSRLEDAIDPRAVPYLEGCFRLWLSSFQCGTEMPDALVQNGLLNAGEHRKLCEQLDLAFSGALRMQGTLPELRAALNRAVPAHWLNLLPQTAAGLGNM